MDKRKTNFVLIDLDDFAEFLRYILFHGGGLLSLAKRIVSQPPFSHMEASASIVRKILYFNKDAECSLIMT
jgi:hypothetical protein